MRRSRPSSPSPRTGCRSAAATSPTMSGCRGSRIGRAPAGRAATPTMSACASLRPPARAPRGGDTLDGQEHRRRGRDRQEAGARDPGRGRPEAAPGAKLAEEPIREEIPLQPGKPARREFEYRRRGTVALLAALLVHTGEIRGSVYEQCNSRVELLDFLELLEAEIPEGK